MGGGELSNGWLPLAPRHAPGELDTTLTDGLKTYRLLYIALHNDRVSPPTYSGTDRLYYLMACLVRAQALGVYFELLPSN